MSLNRSGNRARTSHKPHHYLVTLLLGVSLLLGLLPGMTGIALADPSEKQLKGLKAITAMDSQPSSLRQTPDSKSASGKAKAKAQTNVKALADAANLGTPTQNMGNPADKTILQQDKLSIAETSDGEGEGNLTTQRASALNDTMTSIDESKTTDPIAEGGRALIDHQYPSAGGRFVNGQAESALAFREQLAGLDAVWSLGTVNQTVEQYPMGAAEQAVVGTTYAIVQNGTAITNTAAADSAAFNTQISSTAIGSSPTTGQQWAVVDSGAGDGTVGLISRADGLCLARTGQDTESGYTVVVAPCSGDVTQHWELYHDEFGTLVLSPNGQVQVAGGIGNTAGQGQAGPLMGYGDQSWQFQPVSEPHGSVPTWAVPRTNGFAAGNITAPYDMSVGDLDGVVGADGLYHDEAVVAYTDSNDNWAIRVIDYNANSSRLLATAPASSIPFGKNGWMSGNNWYPGSLIAKIGDFDGDGRLEILSAFQSGDGQFQLSFWRYTANSDGSRSLTLAVNKNNCNSCDGTPFSGAGNTPTLVAGYNTTAVGDFDGDGATDLAVAYASSTKGNLDATQQTPNLGIVTFTGSLGIRSVEVSAITLPAGPNKVTAYLPPAAATDATRTGSGLRLQSGVFSMDPANGFGYQRRELALGWVNAGEAYENVQYGHQESDVYFRQPFFQLYAVNDVSCPSSSTLPVCTSTTALTSEQPNPVSPYPSRAVTYDIVAHGQKPRDVTPMAMAAGAYGGAAADDPPVWGLWFMQWQPTKDLGQNNTNVNYQVATSVVVPWTSDTDPSKPAIADSYATDVGNPLYFTVTGYDRFGDSLILGSPVVFDVDNNKRLEMLAAQPPKHADYLNGKMVNASITNEYYLQTSTSSSTEWSSSITNENTYSNGGSTVDSAKATLTAGIGPFDAKSSAELTETFKAAWTGSNTTSSESGGSQTTKITSEAIDDDVLQFSINDYEVYRYPVLGNLAGGTTCDGNPCSPYYEVTIPQSTIWPSQATGMSETDFAPSWQNDNALSYPQIDGDTGAVPLSDVGSYSYVDSAGTAHSESTPLYNEGNQLGGDITGATLTLTNNTAGSTTTTSGHNWESDTQLNVSASVTVGVPDVDGATFDFSTTDGFQASKTFLDTTVTSNKSTSETSFELKAGEIPSDNGYEVGTAVYYSTAGTPKVVHGVNLTNSAYGTYFTTNYGTTSDVSLNLPGRMVVDKDGNDNFQSPYLSTSYARQLVRGFQVLQVASPNSLLPRAGVPFSGNPTSGTQMAFQVPVYNASLVPMSAGTTAHFWAVPVNSLGSVVTGAKIDLLSVDVPALGAQQGTTVTSAPWTAPTVTDNQQYRIFVVLDEHATMPEVHPLAGDACDPSVLDPNGNSGNQQLYDLMSTDPTAADPTGCGQNNQGYGLVTIAPAPTTAVESTHGTVKKPANVTLDGGGLLDGIKAHEKLTSKSSVPVVPLNANLQGLVYAKADKHATDRQPVLIYDGKPGKGKLIYSGRMPGVSGTSGGAMGFSWTPTEPGLHELHTVILGSSTTGEDDQQVMRVWVDSKPRVQEFTVSAAADKTTAEVGASVRISGTVTPKPAKANDRDVVLQVRKGDGWATVLEKNTAADGTYAFTVSQRTAGAYVYRVKKNAAEGRTTAYSPEVTITVGKPFVVTAKVKPAKIKVGKKTTISGTVSPRMSAAKDRSVQLQVKKGKSWKKVANSSTTAAGAYRFTVKPTKKGTYSYRVLKQAAAEKKAAYSPVVKVKVVKR